MTTPVRRAGTRSRKTAATVNPSSAAPSNSAAPVMRAASTGSASVQGKTRRPRASANPAPANWATTNQPASGARSFPIDQTPSVTAGLSRHPEIGPSR